MRDFLLSAIATAIVVFCAEPSYSQENSSGLAPSAADTGTPDAEVPENAGAEIPTSVSALSSDAKTASLIAERDAAMARIAQLEAELEEADTLTDQLYGQVRKAQRIIRDLDAQCADLNDRSSGLDGAICRDSDASVQCVATASEVDALRSQLAACTESTDSDFSLPEDYAVPYAPQSALPTQPAAPQVSQPGPQITIEDVRTILNDAPGLNDLPPEIVGTLATELANGTCVVDALKTATGDINRQTLIYLYRSGKFCMNSENVIKGE